MTRSQTFQSLGITARRILDFLIIENTGHGGLENGNLCAPYEQLGEWGCTEDDVRKGLEELYLTGFVEQRVVGYRIAGGGDPSRYALTWMPAVAASANDVHDLTVAARRSRLVPPSHPWLKVVDRLQKSGIVGTRATRAWLREETKHLSRAARAKQRAEEKLAGEENQNVTPHMRAA